METVVKIKISGFYMVCFGVKIIHMKRMIVMARHGENIRKRKDGRWEGRFQVYSEEKGKKIYRSVYGHTYNEVREKLTTQKNLLKNIPADSKNRVDLQNISFIDVAEEWLTEIKNKRKLSTYVKYNTIYHNHIENIFNGTLLSDITDVFVKEKLSDQLSDSLCKSIYCVMNQILKFASKRQSIVVPVLSKPSVAVQNKTVKVLNQSEQKKLISALYHEMDLFKMAVMICMLTGLRLGELCALKWSDIDFDNKILIVSRTVQRLTVEEQQTKTILVETVPKSECSQREIPLSDTAMALLTTYQNDKEYVFGGDKPLEPRTMQYHFKKILEEADVTDKNFHILRHTFSTNCIQGGTDVKSLSEMLGHSDVQITLNRYVHPSMDSKRQSMKGLSMFYGQICGQAG